MRGLEKQPTWIMNQRGVCLCDGRAYPISSRVFVRIFGGSADEHRLIVRINPDIYGKSVKQAGQHE